MKTEPEAPPPIALETTERQHLLMLCDKPFSGEEARVAPMLKGELARAKPLRPGPALMGVARMHSIVQFAEGSSERAVLIVYPHEADPAIGRLSILSELGAGLIGLQAGQTIHWPPNDASRPLKVLRVRGPDRLDW